MREDDLMLKLAELLENLGFDYDRLSRSGQATYEEMCSIVNKLLGG